MLELVFSRLLSVLISLFYLRIMCQESVLLRRNSKVCVIHRLGQNVSYVHYLVWCAVVIFVNCKNI